MYRLLDTLFFVRALSGDKHSANLKEGLSKQKSQQPPTLANKLFSCLPCILSLSELSCVPFCLEHPRLTFPPVQFFSCASSGAEQPTVYRIPVLSSVNTSHPVLCLSAYCSGACWNVSFTRLHEPPEVHWFLKESSQTPVCVPGAWFKVNVQYLFVEDVAPVSDLQLITKCPQTGHFCLWASVSLCAICRRNDQLVILT